MRLDTSLDSLLMILLIIGGIERITQTISKRPGNIPVGSGMHLSFSGSFRTEPGGQT